jgi:hypothetical protein
MSNLDNRFLNGFVYKSNNYLASYDVTLQMSIKNVMMALHKCKRWEEQVKVSYHRKFWTFILKIEALVNL